MKSLTERNKEIVSLFKQELEKAGLDKKLMVEPIYNTFTRRPRYFKYADGIPRFKVHLWDLNKLPDDDLRNEVLNRIELARRHWNVTKDI